MASDSVAKLCTSCIAEFDSYLSHSCSDPEVVEQQRHAQNYKTRLLDWMDEARVNNQWQRSLDFLVRDASDMRSALTNILKVLLNLLRRVTDELNKSDQRSDQVSESVSTDSLKTRISRLSTLTVNATNLWKIKKHLVRLEDLLPDVHTFIGCDLDGGSSLSEDNFERYATAVVSKLGEVEWPSRRSLVSAMCQTRSRLLTTRRLNAFSAQQIPLRAGNTGNVDFQPLTMTQSTRAVVSMLDEYWPASWHNILPGEETRTRYACPYCGLMFQGRPSHRDWRIHLKKDLNPYICFIKNCDRSKPFETYKAWVQHLEQHSLHWSCGSTSHAPITHKRFGDAAAHLQQFHPEVLTGSESLLFLRNTARPDLKSLLTDCPFCGALPLSSELKGPIYARLSHIEVHLIKYLLFALPPALPPEPMLATGIEERPKQRDVLSSRGHDIMNFSASTPSLETIFTFDNDELERINRDSLQNSSSVIAQDDTPLLDEPEDWTRVFIAINSIQTEQPAPDLDTDPILSTFRALKISSTATGDTPDPPDNPQYSDWIRSRSDPHFLVTMTEFDDHS